VLSLEKAWGETSKSDNSEEWPSFFDDDREIWLWNTGEIRAKLVHEPESGYLNLIIMKK